MTFDPRQTGSHLISLSWGKLKAQSSVTVRSKRLLNVVLNTMRNMQSCEVPWNLYAIWDNQSDLESVSTEASKLRWRRTWHIGELWLDEHWEPDRLNSSPSFCCHHSDGWIRLSCSINNFKCWYLWRCSCSITLYIYNTRNNLIVEYFFFRFVFHYWSLIQIIHMLFIGQVWARVKAQRLLCWWLLLGVVKLCWGISWN